MKDKNNMIISINAVKALTKYNSDSLLKKKQKTKSKTSVDWG